MAKLVSFIATFFLVFTANAGTIEKGEVKSSILHKNVSYSVYLPPNYHNVSSHFPVIYLLHGYGSDHTAWAKSGKINEYADSAILKGKIPPVIIVMPDAGVSMYVNARDEGGNYEDFFIHELMYTVENSYRITKNKTSRGIIGHSMGGWGTMLYALKYPELFVAASPLSSGIHDDHDIIYYDDARWETVFGSIFGHQLKGRDRLNEYWYRNSILKIVETMPKTSIEKVHYRISCGDQDYLLKGSILLHTALREKGVKHELRIKDGDHKWDYWRSDITEALEFITGYFI